MESLSSWKPGFEGLRTPEIETVNGSPALTTVVTGRRTVFFEIVGLLQTPVSVLA